MLNHRGTKPIETARLLLRRFEPKDAPAVYITWSADPTVPRYMRWMPHQNMEETEAVVRKWADRYVCPDYYHWAVTIKNSGRLIGSVSLPDVCDYDAAGEMAYITGPEFAGHGYATEAARAVLHYLFLDVGLNRVEACHSVNNPASGRVLQKIGMHYEGLSRQKYLCMAGYQDCELYAMLKQDLYVMPKFTGFAHPSCRGDGELSLYALHETPGVPEKNWAPSYVFDILCKGQHAGFINLRVGYNDGIYYSGQIGYMIEHDYRGHGYAARACRLLLPYLQAHGMRAVIITNDPENIASRRTCEKLGADMVRIAEMPQWHDLYKENRRWQCIWEWHPFA